MFYKEYGEENAVMIVFIHGGGVSGWMWEKQVEHFRSTFHCLVPDLPEHGKNTEGSLFTIDSSAEEINVLIKEKSKEKKVIVIGFSLGAQILIAMISKQPKLIDFAMINSALVKPLPLATPLIQSMMLAFPLIKNRTFSKIQAKSMYLKDYQIKTYFEESRQISRETFQRVMQENMSFFLPTDFHQTKARLFVTVGEKERRIMKDSFDEIVESNPACTRLIIPNMGHGVSLGNPELFHMLLEEWLEKEAIANDFR
ncbi:Pimeloyl-ACP methyl ester carboxylesterase [Alkalicoccus daliensis]|uniref:Pimeloyl-ACP methyl ester carboxylesterase n=1 Tax=Alkalicoccus daliensis TaxID=745820 RepID=A0A1H0HEM7_9BACI|nr:Pimeloyl-ACP methyl ester carboxylesterase [Alkalicoccus daliensis]